MSEKICVLGAVYAGYGWMAPFLAEALGRWWPGHPPLLLCGLRAEETPEGLRGNLLPMAGGGESRRTWAGFVLEGVRAARARGFDWAYLVLEEHLPLGPCHVEHLNRTLPELMERHGGVYAGLMGWDNRRYPTRTATLGAEDYSLMRLTGPLDARFHLHPSLWRLDVLERCLENTLRDGAGMRFSAWAFEKVNGRTDADLPPEWKSGCFQVCGRAMRARTPGAGRVAWERAERWLFLRLMGLYPLLPPQWGRRYWAAAGFDDFFYEGPYPMFFSGVMAKGGVNPFFAKFMARTPERRVLMQRMMQARAEWRTPE